MQGKLIRIQSNNSNLRTDYVPGFFHSLPEPGSVFVIIGEPLEEGATARVVTTSTIGSVTKLSDSLYEFTTRNSTYQLEIYG